MPHLIIEYSSNLEERIAIRDLVCRVHEAAMATGVFELSALRTRAERRDVYAIGDGDKDNSFVAVWVRIAKGRDEETRRRVGKSIFDAVCDQLERNDKARSLAISVEVQEIDPTAVFRKNNLRTIAKEPVTRRLLGQL